MSNIILKFGVVCWSFVFLFIVFLTLASLIPSGAILYVLTISGFLTLVLLGKHLRQIHLQEGFDLGWFLTIKKGYWRFLVGLFGLGSFLIGLFGLVFPPLANEIGERHGMKFAYLLVVLFWIALTSTFSSWGLVCFSEATVDWRLGQIKTAFQSFGVGIIYLLLATLFLSLFLDVINENFFNLTSGVQNWILGVFAILNILIGLWNGTYEELKADEDKNSQN